MTHILVAEFLLANTEAARNASLSMLGEASAMLTAVTMDLALAPNNEVTVLLSSETNPFTSTLPNIHVIFGELQLDALPRILLRGDTNQLQYDAVLLIAPECDGVLVSLLKSIQDQPTMQIRSLNLPWRMAEIFADKRATDSWLRQHHISTIPTKTIAEAASETLRNRIVNMQDSANDRYAVLKPRDGAGACGVQIVPFVRQAFQELPQQTSDADHWLLQPFLPGIACSVGFIGGGTNARTIILPPARQSIVNIDNRISYHGGQIPCEPDIVARIQPIAEQLAGAFGPFDGYVGVDLLVDLSVPTNCEACARVVEVNPRLCTSYIGYRMLTGDNLAIWLLQQNAGHEIRWKSETVHFSTL